MLSNTAIFKTGILCYSSIDMLRVEVREEKFDILSESLLSGKCRIDEIIALKSIVDGKKYFLEFVIR